MMMFSLIKYKLNWMNNKERMKYDILLNSLGNGLVSEGRSSEPDDVMADSLAPNLLWENESKLTHKSIQRWSLLVEREEGDNCKSDPRVKQQVWGMCTIVLRL